MNANDAKLTELFTAETGCDVEDNAPNAPAPGGSPATMFDLIIEAVAGNIVGNSGQPYTLSINAVDDTNVAAVPPMSPGTLSQAFNAVNGWTPCGTEFKKRQTFSINVIAAPGGRHFHYEASLVTPNGQIVSIERSDQFVLI